MSRRPPSPRPPARSPLAAPALLVPLALLALLAALASTGCAVRVAGVPVSLTGPERPRRAPAPPPTAVAARAIDRADRYVGVRYRWGGTSPTGGFDCSGYVQYVYGHEGVQLPRTSRQQAHAGSARPVRWDAAAPGDLVLFAEPGAAISHVAFYVGQGRILHASASGGGVRYDDLATRRGQWYRERLVAVRRVSGRGPTVARGLLARLGLAEPPLDPPDGAPAPR